MTRIPGRKFLLCALLLILAACAPLTPESPELIAAAAQARAQAEAAQATANSAEYLARANEMALTATAEAPSIRMTQQAADLEIYMTRQAVDSTATAQSWTPTPSQTPTPDLTATVAVINLEAQRKITEKQASDYIVTSELELQRKIFINRFYAALPGLVFVLMAGSLVIALMMVLRSKRYQPAPVNAQGEVLPIIDTTAHSITDPRRMVNATGYTAEEILVALLMRMAGLQPTQPPITAERQDKATERAQMVDLARATQQQPGSRPALMTPPLLASPQKMSADRFEIVDDNGRLSEIPPEIWKILEAQWENV